MAFWLHENRIILSLRFLKPGYKIMAITILCGVMVAAWAFIFFLPARARLHQELQAQHDFEQQVIAFEKVANKLAALTIECTKLETQIKSFDIQSATLHESIDFLVNSLRTHHILCKNIQPKQKKDKKAKNQNKHEQHEKRSFYEKEYCMLTLVGSFAQMLTFLDEIRLSKRLIAFKTVDLVRGGGNDNTVKVTAEVRIASLQRVS